MAGASNTVADLLKAGARPYLKSTSLTVKILCVKNSTSDHTAYILLGDHTSAVRAVCVDETKSPKLTQGSTVVIKNFTMKTSTTGVRDKYMLINKSTRIFCTKAITVPEDISGPAINAFAPETPDVTTIKAAKMSPLKTIVSIKGKVLQDEVPRTVIVSGKETMVRNLEIADSTGRVRVGLWRNTSEAEISVNDYVKLNNLKVTGRDGYSNETTLSSYLDTDITKEEPDTEDVNTTVIAYDLSDTLVTLLCTVDGDETTYDIPRLLIQQHDLDSTPFEATLTVKGTEVLALAKID